MKDNLKALLNYIDKRKDTFSNEWSLSDREKELLTNELNSIKGLVEYLMENDLV